MRARENQVVGHDGHSPVPLFSDVHDDLQLEEYLDALRRGIGFDLAARQIESTATRMRRFAAREPELKAKIEEAAAEGQEYYRERLQATARVIALNTDNPSPRILEVELATHVPAYGHLKRDRVRHEGHVTHGITIDLDPAKLDALPPEKLKALREALADLEDATIEDAEFSEIKELTA